MVVQDWINTSVSKKRINVGGVGIFVEVIEKLVDWLTIIMLDVFEFLS